MRGGGPWTGQPRRTKGGADEQVRTKLVRGPRGAPRVPLTGGGTRGVDPHVRC